MSDRPIPSSQVTPTQCEQYCKMQQARHKIDECITDTSVKSASRTPIIQPLRIISHTATRAYDSDSTSDDTFVESKGKHKYEHISHKKTNAHTVTESPARTKAPKKRKSSPNDKIHHHQEAAPCRSRLKENSSSPKKIKRTSSEIREAHERPRSIAPNNNDGFIIPNKKTHPYSAPEYAIQYDNAECPSPPIKKQTKTGQWKEVTPDEMITKFNDLNSKNRQLEKMLLMKYKEVEYLRSKLHTIKEMANAYPPRS